MLAISTAWPGACAAPNHRSSASRTGCRPGHGEIPCGTCLAPCPTSSDSSTTSTGACQCTATTSGTSNNGQLRSNGVIGGECGEGGGGAVMTSVALKDLCQPLEHSYNRQRNDSAAHAFRTHRHKMLVKSCMTTNDKISPPVDISEPRSLMNKQGHAEKKGEKTNWLATA